MRKFSIILIVAISLVMVVTSFLYSEEVDKSETKDEEKNSGLVFYPFLAYSPETKIMGGVAGIYYYRPEGVSRASNPSQLSAIATYTQKQQFHTQLKPDVYFQNDLYNLSGEFEFQKFPNQFFGVGNQTPDDPEDYTSQEYKFAADFKRNVLAQLKVGLGFTIRKTELKEYEDDGKLSVYQELGMVDELASGLNFSADWDTRDNVFYPLRGSYHQFSFTLFREAFGSSYDFERYEIDIRKYFPIAEKNVLGFRAFLDANDGDVPLLMMPKFGGDEARGYYEGRYIDKNMLVFIAEYRMHVWRKFGVVAFVGIGDVSGTMGNFRLSEFKHSFGGGIRYMLNQEEKITVRVDYGMGDGVSNIYFQAMEAF